MALEDASAFFGSNQSIYDLPTVNRACRACNRKKIKCDMRRPSCGLCSRLGAQCTFPLRQKPPRGRRQTTNSENQNVLRSPISEILGTRERYAPHDAGAQSDIHIASLVPAPGSGTWIGGSQDTFSVTGTHNSVPDKIDLVHSRHSDNTVEFAGIASLPTPQEEAHRLSPQHFPYPGLNSVAANLNIDTRTLTGHSDCSDSGTDWGIPADVANELVELYYQNIQPWLPIMHRPLFFEKFMRAGNSGQSLVSAGEIDLHAAFMIKGMFALASRFSTNHFFPSTPIQSPGKAFASQAVTIKDSIIKTVGEPPLEFVKGCILLAWYHITAGELAPGSVLTSICVRFAYDLDLDQIDADSHDGDGSANDILGDPDTWVLKEELRRVWWTIWELDTFVATLSRQPYGIDKRSEMRVLLPVADQNWISCMPAKSSMLDHRPMFAWKGLQSCPNRNPWAWLLICKHIKSCMAVASRQLSFISSATIDEFERALCCFKLALPTEFQLRETYLNDQNFVDGNWIISTHLMVLSCELILGRLVDRCNQSGNPPTIRQGLTPSDHRLTQYLIHIGSVWPAGYIALTNPVMSCCVVLPGYLSLQQSDAIPQGYEVAKLILTHIARYWNLGHVVLRLLSAIKQGQDLRRPQLASGDRDIVRRLSVLLPTSLSDQTSRPSATTIPAESPDTVGPRAEELPNLDFEDMWNTDLLQWPFDMWTYPGES